MEIEPPKAKRRLKREREEGDDAAATATATAAATATATAMEIEAPKAKRRLKREAKRRLKREREEGDDSAAGAAAEAAEEAPAKKAKVEEEEKDEEDVAGKGDEEGSKGEEGKTVKLGPKEFDSAVEMYDYFFDLLTSWSPNLDCNKYECMVLEDLLKKGHPEHDKKIGHGIKAFGVRNHPKWKTRCFFVRRVDGSTADFAFRKCINNILPLPHDLKNLRKTNGSKGGGGRLR